MFYYAQTKMAKSTTKNASTEFDVEKIRRFTQTELEKLSNSDDELPFCYQLGHDVLVGRYRVVKVDDRCWRVIENKQHIFDFLNRKDAIFYCIALFKQNTKLANEIRDNDSFLNKLEFEASLYRLRYKKAQETGDTWNEELYSTRYTEIQHKITQVKKEIKKNLNLAKYIKV